MESPHSILKKVFGYDSFRPGQEDAVFLKLSTLQIKVNGKTMSHKK